MIVPSLFKVARFAEDEDKAEFIGFTLAVLSTADINGDRPFPSLTFVEDMAVTVSAAPSKAMSLPSTLTVTASPIVTVALSMDGKTLAPTPVAGLKVGSEDAAAVSKDVRFAPL